MVENVNLGYRDGAFRPARRQLTEILDLFFVEVSCAEHADVAVENVYLGYGDGASRWARRRLPR